MFSNVSFNEEQEQGWGAITPCIVGVCANVVTTYLFYLIFKNSKETFEAAEKCVDLAERKVEIAKSLLEKTYQREFQANIFNKKTEDKLANRSTPFSVFSPECNRKKDYLSSDLGMGIDLVEKARKNPSHISLAGRETALKNLKVTLGKTETPNTILVGPSGCGKTTLVEAFANDIAQNTEPSFPFKDTRIISLSASDFTAGCSLIGMTEERVQRVLDYAKRHKDVIFFIDEFHSVMNQGGYSTNGVPNMLKAALANGDIRVIGGTTPEEMKMIEKDSAFMRRFTVTPLKSPEGIDLEEIIQVRVEKYSAHHGVEYSPEAVTSALRLTATLPGNEPAKTLALLDMAGSFVKLNKEFIVTESTILKVFQQELY